MAKVFQDPRRRQGGLRPWCISYVGLDGKRHREVTPATTRAEAEGLLARKQSEIAKAQILGLPQQSVRKISFEEFVEKEFLPHCEKAKRPETVALYRSVYGKAKGLLGPRPLASITPADLREHLTRRAEDKGRSGDLTAATLGKVLTVLSAIFSDAVAAGYLQRNPAHGVPRPRADEGRLRWITKAEEGKLLAWCSVPFGAMVEFTLHTGLRRREVKALDWSAVDLAARVLCVAESKSHKPRYIPLNLRAQVILRSIAGPQVPTRGPVFLTPAGHPYERVSSIFREAADRAGLEGVSFHTLRHTFASRLAQAGVPLNTIRELLGHADIKMTLRYAHLAPHNLEDAVGRLTE